VIDDANVFFMFLFFFSHVFLFTRTSNVLCFLLVNVFNIYMPASNETASIAKNYYITLISFMLYVTFHGRIVALPLNRS